MLRFIKNIGHLLFRVWFYILAAIPILVFMPIWLVLMLSEKTYGHLYWIARNFWAAPILYGMACIPKINWMERMEHGKQYMLVANHTSMLDAMLMLRISKTPVVFVGKKELEQIPIFGFVYKRVCILVDRSDRISRGEVYDQVQRKLKFGYGVCIFPEGGVPEEHIILDEFKDGAFNMAHEHMLPIVPMVFLDCKERFSWTFFSGGPGILRVNVHPFFKPENFQVETPLSLKKRTRELILTDLEQDL